MKKPLLRKIQFISHHLPKQQYRVLWGVREINHVLRIKKRFKKYGVKGVIEYCRKFIKPEKFGEFKELIKKDLI